MLSWTKNLQKYLDNNLNVLLCGAGGVGKTAVIKELFQKNFGDDWLYIAGATCDPFTDLLGVPRPVKDEATGKEVLDFVKPRKLQLNKVKAIFCDEYNRAPKKVMNALMEIIQFKSLGNEPVPNLRMVWCAVNPDDEDYNIEEKLDRSQKDRFHIWIDVPYMIDVEYFNKTYGADITDGTKEWWNGLPDNVRKAVSPRRLEYAITVFNMGGDLREVLPPSTNISQLMDNLVNGSMKSQIAKLFSETETVASQKLKENPNLMTAISNKLDDEKTYKKFAHLVPEEILAQKAPTNPELCQYIKSHSNKFPPSTIVALDKLGCFNESSFGPMFATLNKYFPQGGYTSGDRKRLHKVFSLIPPMEKATINPADTANLQKLIDTINQYTYRSNYSTVPRDNQKYKFVEKLSQLKEMCSKLGIPLDFKEGSYRSIYRFIREYDERKAREAVTSTANVTQTV